MYLYSYMSPLYIINIAFKLEQCYLNLRKIHINDDIIRDNNNCISLYSAKFLIFICKLFV